MAAPDAPAPAARPSTTTRASVPATPSEAPRSVERCFVVEDIDRPPWWGDASLGVQTRQVPVPVAFLAHLYLLFANLLPRRLLRDTNHLQSVRRTVKNPPTQELQCLDGHGGRGSEQVSEAGRRAGRRRGRCALLAYYIVGYLVATPPNVQARRARRRSARVTLQTVASLGTPPHPDWVSYLVKKPERPVGALDGADRAGELARHGHRLPVRHGDRAAQSRTGAGRAGSSGR